MNIKIKTDTLERAIYSEICSHDGIKAKDIGKKIAADRKTINQYLYKAPFMRELCYQDQDFRWHGLIRQSRPHIGLGDFCGYYGTVREFLALDENEWFEAMLSGCRNIGRNLNDTRGLFHSFLDCREVLLGEDYDVIPCLVLTKADDLYRHVQLGESDALLPVCSGNMLFNLFDEYMGFLEE